ncbi:MAG: hypothetical protein KDB82_13360 [Planctomycetes bacterium]|nr:hypothetical protein [Planctomycetota bacterium]
MRLLSALLLLIATGCAMTPAKGVEYIEPAKAERSATIKRLRDGLKETAPGSGVYEIVLSVMNTHSAPSTFTLSLQDDDGLRTIWQRERIKGHISLMSEPGDADLNAATRMAVVKVKGMSATITVNGEATPITLLKGHSTLWIVRLSDAGDTVSHFDMH